MPGSVIRTLHSVSHFSLTTTLSYSSISQVYFYYLPQPRSVFRYCCLIVTTLMHCQCHRSIVYLFIYCMYICTLHTQSTIVCLSPKNPCHPFGDIEHRWECIIYTHHFHTVGRKTEPWRDWPTCSRPHIQKRQTPVLRLISLDLQFKLSAYPFPRNGLMRGRRADAPSWPPQASHQPLQVIRGTRWGHPERQTCI